MLVKTNTGTIHGVEGLVIHVEVDMAGGITKVRMVGLPDAAVREAQVRVRSALINSGFGKLEGEVTVNLAPADVKKQGSAFDLAVALGLVAAKQQAPVEPLENTLFLGELALDGNLRPVRGVLPAVLQAAKSGIRRVVVPKANGAEAALVKDVSVYTVDSLREAVDLVSSDWVAPEPITRPNGTRTADGADLSDVKGQRSAKRALEVAAAGAGTTFSCRGHPARGRVFSPCACLRFCPRFVSSTRSRSRRFTRLRGSWTMVLWCRTHRFGRRTIRSRHKRWSVGALGPGPVR